MRKSYRKRTVTFFTFLSIIKNRSRDSFETQLNTILRLHTYIADVPRSTSHHVTNLSLAYAPHPASQRLSRLRYFSRNLLATPQRLDLGQHVSLTF
jgi:hypothetical protein